MSARKKVNRTRAQVDRDIIRYLRSELKKRKPPEQSEAETAALKERIAYLEASARFDREWLCAKLADADDRINRANDQVAAMSTSNFHERLRLAQSDPGQMKTAIAERDLEIELLRKKLAHVESKLRAAKRAAKP